MKQKPQIDPHAVRQVTLNITEVQLRMIGSSVMDCAATLLQSEKLAERVEQEGIFPSPESFRASCRNLRDAIVAQYAPGEILRPYKKDS